MDFEFEEVRCLCGKDVPITLTVIQLRDGRDVRIVECQDCRLQYMSPRPDKEFLNWMYREEYYAMVMEDMDMWTEKTLEHERERESVHLYRLRPIMKMRERYGYRKLLDIGTGAGYFLKLAKDRGFDVLGIEVSERASEFARKNYGVPVLNIAKVEDAMFQDGSFDVVTLSHVIEHLPYPQRTLEEIHRILRHNGTLLIVTPNCRSLPIFLSVANRRLGYPVKPLEDAYTIKTWKNGCYYLHPKRLDDEGYRKYLLHNFHHLYFLNSKALKKLLLQCNFLINAYPVGGYDYGARGIRRLFSNRLVNPIARIFNLQKEIMFYARKA